MKGISWSAELLHENNISDVTFLLVYIEKSDITYMTHGHGLTYLGVLMMGKHT